MSVHVPDEENTTRNLIPRVLVGEWMREAVARLYARQPALAGAVAADGGRPAEDLMAALPDANWKEVTPAATRAVGASAVAALPDANWKEVTGEFFLTD